MLTKLYRTNDLLCCRSGSRSGPHDCNLQGQALVRGLRRSRNNP